MEKEGEEIGRIGDGAKEEEKREEVESHRVSGRRVQS